MAGLNGVQVWLGSLDKSVISAQGFPATTAALAKISDGFFSADVDGRAKFADGFVTPGLLSDVYLLAFTAPDVERRGFSELVDTVLTPPTNVVVNEVSARSFLDGQTNEVSASFSVPDVWDGVSDMTFHLVISPSTSESNTFNLSTEYRINGGSITIGQTTNVSPSSLLDVQTETVVLMTIPAVSLSVGDLILFKVKRDGAGDSHAGNMRVFESIMKVGV